jgi:primosomal protein N' (replication factor Y)
MQKAQNYEEFFNTEIDLRNETAYPPFSQIIRLVASSKNTFRAERLCAEIVLKMSEIIDKQGLAERLEILGPAPCLISRIKDEFRFQIIIKNRLEDKGHFFITSFIQKIIIPDDIKLIIDIDPIDML